MRIQTHTFLFVAACLAGYSVPAGAQQFEARTIYVSEVAGTAAPTNEERKIAAAAASVLELRLNSIKELNVTRGPVICDSQDKGQQGPPVPQPEQVEQVKAPLANASPVIYEVITAIKTLSGDNNTQGLILEYDVLKYVQCKPAPILHREEPISLKTGFQGLLQMGDVIEIALEGDLAPYKTIVDMGEISASGESHQAIRDYLVRNVLFKLAAQPDLKVRDLRAGKPPDSPADYVVAGKIVVKSQKGVEFTVKNLKAKKEPERFFISGPIGPKNPDEKLLAAFYEKASMSVINSIRAQRDNVGPLSDDEVPLILERASKWLCEKPCESQPESAIPLLVRLRDYDKASAKALELLGDAYTEVEEYQKAAESYDQARAKLLPTGSAGPDAVRWLIKAGEAFYKAQNYTSAAERFELAIEASLKLQLPVAANLYLQWARSYRIAGNRVQALQVALRGLTAFSDSPELDEEVDNILKSMAGEELASAYQVLSSNQSIGKIAQKLPDARTRFADYLIGLVVEHLDARKFEEVDKHLKTIEALPLAALTNEQQKRHKITRALWAMQAKNDFDTAIAAFTPLINDTEDGEVVQFPLALALYDRARAAGASSDKTDYARASELLTKLMVKEPDSGVYNLLLATNHQLGKDQESRQIIDEKLKANKDDSEALRALAALCIDYLGDLGCGETVTQQMELRAISNWKIRMSTVLLHILRGNYGEAEKAIDGPLRSFEDPEVVVASFYRVWTSLALNKESEAEKALAEWLTVMEKLRGIGQRTYWTFDSASRGVETDQALLANKKDLLRRMIASMLTPSEPLPSAADFFPASKSR